MWYSTNRFLLWELSVDTKRCNEIVCFWAGFIVETHPVEKNSIKDIIDAVQNRLNAGEVTFMHTGVTHLVKELCVDGRTSFGRSFRVCDLKKK